MKNRINASLQILPTSKTLHPYDIVDEAIAIIKASGLNYKVCPFETVIEGSYDEVMDLIKKVYQHCMQLDIENIFSYIKIQMQQSNDVSINDKIGKYKD